MRKSNATVRDVAIAAGVSTATVSRVLNLDSRAADGRAVSVADDTRARVLAAAERLDYKTNHVARSLKTRSTRTVAILAPELSNDFFMELAEGMERELEKSGYMLLVSSSSNSAAEEERRLRVLSARLVDGIVVIPASERGDHLRAIADRGTPVVLVDRLVEDASLDAVLADNSGGAYGATRALLEEGRLRAVFVGGDLRLTTARERLEGYRRAVADSPGVETLEPRLGGMGIDEGYRHMDELLRSGTDPDALFAVNLLVHLGMERRLLEESALAADRLASGRSVYDRSVYDRLAIASFDETPYSPFLAACRYSVAQPAAEMGAAAARLILERIAAGGSGSGPSAQPRVLRLPTVLIRHPRGSGPR